jgi:hypothetical protein
MAAETVELSVSDQSEKDAGSFHEPNDSDSQLTRIWSMHWSTLRRINALGSLIRRALGIPIHSGRDAL